MDWNPGSSSYNGPFAKFGGDPFAPKFDLEKARAGDKKKKKKKSSSSSGASSGFTLGGLGKSNVGGVAEKLENQGNLMAQQALQKSGLTSTETNPLTELMNNIMGQYESINVAPTPFEQLKAIAEQQVGAQFDPMIQMLKDQMGQTEQRGKRNMGEARSMYGALSKDFLSQIPEMTQQFAQEDRETNQRYDSAQQELQKQYGNQQGQQQAVLQQLGIQAAAPDASQQSMDDQKYFQGQMETDQQSALSALNQQQLAQQNYQQNLGNTTAVAGENAAQDISQQLRDYMASANSQMGGLQSQRGGALATLLQQMQSQAQQAAADEEQQQFQNLMALGNFQLSAAKAAGDAESQNQDSLFKGTTGLPGAQNFLAQQYSNSPIRASNIMEQLNDVLSNPDVTKGKYILEPASEDGTRAAKYSDVGQQMMEDLLRREIEKENQSSPGRYGNADISNAIAALQAYLGKLR